MRDVSSPLTAMFFSELNGNIADINAGNVPVYNYVEGDVSGSYIHLVSVTTSEEGDKDVFGQRAVVTLDVVTDDTGPNRGTKNVDYIADDILQTMMVKRTYEPLNDILSNSQHYIISMEVTGNTLITSESNGVMYWVRRLTFNILTSQ